MSSDLVITEKSSQARDVRAAVGNRYGQILPAEGHLITLREPEEVNPAWSSGRQFCCAPMGSSGPNPRRAGTR